MVNADKGLWVRRTRQTSALREKEAALQEAASAGHKQEFFVQILPLLDSLKSYIKRRLKVAYLSLDAATPIYTSGDILNTVILKAYKNYALKPKELTLEQWLYQIANDVLDRYIHLRQATDRRRRSLEHLTQAELRTLEEVDDITSDAEGEIYLAEDLDDSELPPRDFDAPADTSNPENILEEKEELEQLFRALAQVPVQDRIVFELSAVEGFSDDEVARIAHVSPEQVPRIVQNVRAEILRHLKGEHANPESYSEAQLKKTA
jgi:RNA polymerase sigma factor (sigma-70 family)